jgi:hypothetical protein
MVPILGASSERSLNGPSDRCADGSLPEFLRPSASSLRDVGRHRVGLLFFACAIFRAFKFYYRT